MCVIDDYLQKNIGTVRYVNFPNEDQNIFEAGSTIFSVETEKWVGYFVAPFIIEIIERNKDLLNDPSLINRDCYGKGWLLQVSLTQQSIEQLNNLFHKEKLIIWLKNEIIADKSE